MRLPAEVREFLAAPRFAVLATLRPDGLPRQSAMWYDLEDDQILLNTAEGRKKLDDIRRDPRVSLCIVDGYRYVTIIGRARLIDDPERGQADIARLAVRYHGPEEAKAYIPQYQQQRRVTILVEPSRCTGTASNPRTTGGMGVGNEVRLIGLSGIPEAEPGDDVGAFIAHGLEHAGLRLEPHDVIVVTHKLVSKAEGRLIELASVTPSPFAETIARRYGKDPRHVEVVLQESVRIVRMDRGVLICETRHGFICANAGVDASNVPPGWVSLLPLDPDASAARIRATLLARYGVEHAVIITDSFGRPWRNGIVNVAIGVAGMLPLIDYRGQADTFGNELRVTVMAVADELAAAAELVTGKTTRCPVVLVRGYAYLRGEGSARDLVMPAERDLFR